MMNYEQQQQFIAMNNFTNLTNLTNMGSVNHNFSSMMQQQQQPQPPTMMQMQMQMQAIQPPPPQVPNTTTTTTTTSSSSKKSHKLTPNTNNNNNRPPSTGMTPIISTPLQLSSVNTPLQQYQPNSQLQPQSPLIKKSLSSNSPKSKSNSNNNNIPTPTYSSATINSPYLEVIEQESISVENVIINNRNSNVHIVVKNTSFVLKIKSLDMNKINFSTSCVKAGLYYVNEPLKEVSFIQNPPITYVGSSCKNGEQFAIDIKISILSSQHQGNLFYIMVNVSPENLKATPKDSKDSKLETTLTTTTSTTTTSTSPSCNSLPIGNSILSFPIRVVSKVDHIKKDPNGVCEKKQTFIDILTDRLSVLENIHMTQSSLLSNMLRERGIPESEYSFSEYSEPDLISFNFSTSPPSSPFSISANNNQQQSKKNKKSKKHNATSTNNNNNNSNNNNNNNGIDNKNTAERFLECFNRVIKVYKEDNYCKKSLELSNFINSLEYDEKIILVDLLESFTFDESSQVKTNNTNGETSNNEHSDDCSCETCPYKQQAEQFMLLSPVICFPSPAIKSTLPSTNVPVTATAITATTVSTPISNNGITTTI